LDLAGPLMAQLFRTQFKVMAGEMHKYMKKQIDNGKQINLSLAIRARIITQGLRYSLATGNWGEQKNCKWWRCKSWCSASIKSYDLHGLIVAFATN
jgi:DNA-directed RNA polymerase beta subunit